MFSMSKDQLEYHAHDTQVQLTQTQQALERTESELHRSQTAIMRLKDENDRIKAELAKKNLEADKEECDRRHEASRLKTHRDEGTDFRTQVESMGMQGADDVSIERPNLIYRIVVGSIIRIIIPAQMINTIGDQFTLSDETLAISFYVSIAIMHIMVRLIGGTTQPIPGLRRIAGFSFFAAVLLTTFLPIYGTNIGNIAITTLFAAIFWKLHETTLGRVE